MSAMSRGSTRFAAPALGALVAAAAALPFLPALRFGFVNFEDLWVIADNPPLRALGFANLRWMATSLDFGTYQPLGWLAYALELRLGAGSPAPFHAVNLLVHALCAASLFALLRELLRLGAGGDDGPRDLCAAAAALLWAVHPLQAEPVAWAAEQPDLLAALLGLWALLAYLAASAGPERRRRPLLAASWLLFAASLLSRWRFVPLPLLLLVLDIYPLRRLPASPARWREPGARRVLLEKLPFLALAAAFLAANLASKLRIAPRASAFEHPEILSGLVFYLWKAVWPFPLTVSYALDASLPALLRPAPAAALLCALSAGAWLGRRRRPALLAAWLAYLALTAPVLGGTRPGAPLVVHDRYAYAALMPLAALLAGALLRFRPGPSRTAALAAAAALALALGAAARAQAWVWRDSISLWTHALAAGPAPFYARPSLALALLNEGRVDEAIAALREQLALFPDDEGARRLLALASVDPRRSK